MPTIFRFTIQTDRRRYSEIWSFFCNSGLHDVYATRTSMKKWLKISFHASGDCHVKVREKDAEIRDVKEFDWKSKIPSRETPSHLLKLMYPIDKQNSKFPVDRRVPIKFENWGGRGTIELNMHVCYSEVPLCPDEELGIVAAHHLGDKKWLYFHIAAGPVLTKLPEPNVGMTFHFGEPIRNEGEIEGLRNSTAVWYSLSDGRGPLTITERSWNILSFDELRRTAA